MKFINCINISFIMTEGNCFVYRSRSGGSDAGQKSDQTEEANLASINHGLKLALNSEKNE